MTGSFAATVVDANTFSISTAGSATIGNVYGNIDRVTTMTTRYYYVGNNEIQLELNNGYVMRKGIEWDEVGTTNALSNQVKIYRDVVLGDFVSFVIRQNGGQMMINSTSQATRSVIVAGMSNASGSTLLAGTPVRNSLTGLQKIDITNISSEGIIGVVFDTSIINGAAANVLTNGVLEAFTTSFSNGDIIYVDVSGNLTNVRPVVGSGSYIIMIGTVKLNITNPTYRDLVVNIKLIKNP
jgi:hypothetical protein